MNGLVIDLDPAFTEKVRSLLEREGYATSVTHDVAAALTWLEGNRPDLLIVDRDLLVSQGQALLHTLQQHDDLPLMFLTSAKIRERAPHAEASVLERIERIVRQATPTEVHKRPRIQLGELLIDTPRRRAIFRGKRLPLTPIQFRLLKCLGERAGEVVDHRELLRETWGYDGDDQEARELLKVHVRQIRRKIGLQAKDNEYLVSVRGFGYMLMDPEEDRESS